MNSTSWKRWLAWVFGAFCLVQFGTYFWRAESQLPLAGLRTVGALERREEFVAFAKSTWDELTPVQRRAVVAESNARTTNIYHSENEIPDRYKYFEPLSAEMRRHSEEMLTNSTTNAELREFVRQNLERGSIFRGYRQGCLLEWKREWSALFFMRCDSSWWVSGVGAMGRSDLFVWLLGRWWRVWNFYLVVS
jgi:uncharacterized protein YbdZ (MbtH family)